MRILLIVNPTAGGAARNRVNLLHCLAGLSGHTLTAVAPDTPEGTVEATRRGVAEG
jgi:hypothetical protein